MTKPVSNLESQPELDFDDMQRVRADLVIKDVLSVEGVVIIPPFSEQLRRRAVLLPGDPLHIFSPDNLDTRAPLES